MSNVVMNEYFWTRLRR